MAVEIDDTLTFLLGSWAIDRRIDDHRDHGEVTFRGVAVIEPTADGALYAEHGTLTRGIHTGPARRNLRFRTAGEGRVHVDFPDGHRFLELDLSAGRCAARHPCRADVYAMAYEVLGTDRICETWEVSGPEKAYSARTIWTRDSTAVPRAAAARII